MSSLFISPPNKCLLKVSSDPRSSLQNNGVVSLRNDGQSDSKINPSCNKPNASFQLYTLLH